MLHFQILWESGKKKSQIISFTPFSCWLLNQIKKPTRTQQPLEYNSCFCIAKLCIGLTAGKIVAQHHLFLNMLAASYHSRDLLAYPFWGTAELMGRTSVTRERDLSPAHCTFGIYPTKRWGQIIYFDIQDRLTVPALVNSPWWCYTSLKYCGR